MERPRADAAVRGAQRCRCPGPAGPLSRRPRAPPARGRRSAAAAAAPGSADTRVRRARPVACAGKAPGAGGRRALPSRKHASADGALCGAGRGQLHRCPAAPTGPSPDRFAPGTAHAGGPVTSHRRRVPCVCESSSPCTGVGFCDAKETGAQHRYPLHGEVSQAQCHGKLNLLYIKEINYLREVKNGRSKEVKVIRRVGHQPWLFPSATSGHQKEN